MKEQIKEQKKIMKKNKNFYPAKEDFSKLRDKFDEKQLKEMQSKQWKH